MGCWSRGGGGGAGGWGWCGLRQFTGVPLCYFLGVPLCGFLGVPLLFSFAGVCGSLLEALRVGLCVPLLTLSLLLFTVVPTRAHTHYHCMVTGPYRLFFQCCAAGPHQPLHVHSPDSVADARGLAQPRLSYRLSCRLRAVLRVSRLPAHDRMSQLPAHVDPFLALPLEAALAVRRACARPEATVAFARCAPQTRCSSLFFLIFPLLSSFHRPWLATRAVGHERGGGMVLCCQGRSSAAAGRCPKTRKGAFG